MLAMVEEIAGGSCREVLLVSLDLMVEVSIHERGGAEAYFCYEPPEINVADSFWCGW